MDNLSTCAVPPWQPDAVTTGNSCDSPASAFGWSVAMAGQTSGLFDHAADAPRVDPDSPSETKVSTRSTTPCVAEGNQVREITDLDTCHGDFENWVDKFLSIPINEYLQINERVLQKIDRSYHLYMKKPNVNSEFVTFIQIKHLLNRLLCNWQLKQNKEQTRKQLISLHAYTQDKRYLTHYLQNWVFMKCCKDIFCGRAVNDHDRQAFAVIMSEILYTEPNAGMRRASLPFLDVVSLATLYNIGGLPGFEENANHEECFKIILLHRHISEDNYLFFSPISFTALDYMRFSPEDLSQKLADQKQMLPPPPGINIMQMITAIFMLSENKMLLQWLSQEKHFDYDVYLCIREVLLNYYLILNVIINKSDELRELPALKEKLFCQMQQCELLTSGTKDDCSCLFNCLRAKLILTEKELPPRHRYAKVGSIYTKSAERYPNHWNIAYYFCHKAGMWNAAAHAARQYVSYWRGKDTAMAEYWSDKYNKELADTKPSQLPQPSDQAQQQYDIETILREFSAEPPPQVKKKKHRRQKNTSTGAVSTETITGHPQTAKPVTLARKPCQPVIKALPFGANRHDGLPGEYLVKSAQRAIRPFEKLLSRHWNPLVKKTLNLIRHARYEGDLAQERRIYQQLLDNPKLKACIGIERIWEECAWTELHQFDDCFKARAVPESIRPEAQKWINMARERYIMPSLAYCLNLDQICARIAPDAVCAAVLQLVEQPELAQPDINQEIRFRLRCLFSSMGHTYSLCAMANPPQSRQLMEVARKWYGFKSIIDPQRKEFSWDDQPGWQ